MPPITSIALKALDNIGGPRILLAAIPGGIGALADISGVTRGRVSQVLHQDPLPGEWAQRIAGLIGCGEWEVYQQLGQVPPLSRNGPLFDLQGDPQT